MFLWKKKIINFWLKSALSYGILLELPLGDDSNKMSQHVFLENSENYNVSFRKDHFILKSCNH